MVWIREVVGWVLLGVGLAAFALCYFVFLLPGRIVEGAAMVAVGAFIFRGGTHLLKVAMAAKAAADVRTTRPAAKKPVELRMGGTAAVGRGSSPVVPGIAKGR